MPRESTTRVSLSLLLGPSILGALALGSIGCASHPREPLEPLESLAALDEEAVTRLSGAPTLDLPALTALALERNPGLRALRAELGVASAELVAAGLLPDPTVSFNAIELIAPEVFDGDSTTKDVVTGLGLEWPVPRPGEIPAKKGAAEASLEETRHRIVAAEWSVAREVALAHHAFLGARRHVELHRVFYADSTRLVEALQKARATGEVTDLELNLSIVDLGAADLERVTVDAEEAAARRKLLEVLALPPETPLELQEPEGQFRLSEAPATPDDLFRSALEARPDLKALESRYRRAEEELSLQCALRWPALSIGTIFSLDIPIFSRLNQPGVERALAERERVRQEYLAAVHALRAEIHEAAAAVATSGERLRRAQERLRPALDRSLALAEEAFRERAVGVGPTLVTKLLILRTEEDYLEALREHGKARIELEAATGMLFPALEPPTAGEEPRP